ncbi:MAG: glycosyltransferase [Candidatus Hydrogenedentes bacterium]|nr:glycosyltransferase [Candidatus Hydrogenedentota bacterium]
MSESRPPDLSFVVIGYNEGKHIRDCLESARSIAIPGAMTEVIYVDGGSHDKSIDEARLVEGVVILGGEKRRRAAQNRNLGAEHATGKYIQFIDGDMYLDADWPARAMRFLEEHPDIGAVAGTLEEANTSFVFRVMQIDWNPVEGESDVLGGAAMYRRDLFDQAGGFPEDVSTGEDPLLCWRIRNVTGHKVWYLRTRMAKHDLGFRGLRDYWKRCTTTGRAYIEIASRCWNTKDPMWKPNVIRNFGWALAYIAVLALASVLVVWIGLIGLMGLMALMGLILARVAFNTWRHGHPPLVSLGYAIHVYAAKVPLAWGQLKWILRRASQSRVLPLLSL